MTAKNIWYYKNSISGEVTADKNIKNNWVNAGFDVEYYRFSEVFNDFIIFLIEEGKNKA